MEKPTKVVTSKIIPTSIVNNLPSILEKEPEKKKPKGPTKFGMFQGVFTPTLLTILGVIIYLRGPWVVGNAGVLG